MDAAKFPRPCRLLAGVALTAVLLSPCIARAVGIGEVTLQGKLGAPLYVQVELRTASDENIEASCLSLAAPDPQDQEAPNYLLDARLEIKTEGARRYAVISSHRTLDEPFAKMRLQVNCPGMGSLTRTLTLLPNLDTMLPTAIAARATESLARAYFGAGESAPKAAPPAARRHAQTISKKQKRQATVGLRISAGPIDESRSTRILVPQHPVKQRTDALGGIKLKLAWLISSASAAETPAPPIAGMPERNPTAADAWPFAAVKRPPVMVQQDTPMLQRGLLGAGLALVITVLLLLRRRHSRRNSQRSAMPVLTQAVAEAGPAVVPIVSPHIGAPAPGAPRRTQPPKEKEGMTKQDSMVEEAELFAVHGHPNKAIKLLREIIAQNPAHSEARMLLFSVLFSLGRAEEFEQAARDFLKYDKNSGSWTLVQTLGRTLDQGNPLYAGEGNLGAAAIFPPQIAVNKRRAVGHILVEMGALSVQGMKNCLADFDPKMHGRFGGYLISRKFVTAAQLNEALLKQQGAGA